MPNDFILLPVIKGTDGKYLASEDEAIVGGVIDTLRRDAKCFSWARTSTSKIISAWDNQCLQ